MNMDESEQKLIGVEKRHQQQNGGTQKKCC